MITFITNKNILTLWSQSANLLRNFFTVTTKCSYDKKILAVMHIMHAHARKEHSVICNGNALILLAWLIKQSLEPLETVWTES